MGMHLVCLSQSLSHALPQTKSWIQNIYNVSCMTSSQFIRSCHSSPHSFFAKNSLLMYNFSVPPPPSFRMPVELNAVACQRYAKYEIVRTMLRVVQRARWQKTVHATPTIIPSIGENASNAAAVHRVYNKLLMLPLSNMDHDTVRIPAMPAWR